MSGTTRIELNEQRKSEKLRSAASRLKKRRDFLRIQRKGVRVSGEFLTLYAQTTRFRESPKVGLTVSKAVGKANERNLVKRRLRHIARSNRSRIGKLDLVVVAKPGAALASFDSLTQDFLRLVEAVSRKMVSFRKQKERK